MLDCNCRDVARKCVADQSERTIDYKVGGDRLKLKKAVKVKKDRSRFYENFDTKEGQKDTHYRIAAARDRQAKDLGQMSTTKKY